TSDRDRRFATLESELCQSNLTRDRLVRDRDHLDLQVHQLRSNIRDMEAFQHGQRNEITRLETEISNLTHAIGDDPGDPHTQVLQLRTERNDFERHTISAREDLHNAETDRDRLRLEAVQAGDEIRDLQAQIRSLERDTDDARSESAAALASYNRISSSPIQLHPPLFPAEAWIPHYSALKLFTAAEIHPWDPTIVGTMPIIAMNQATLTKRMPIPASFLFPYRVPPVRAPIPMVGYLSGLITGAHVLALMATERMLGRRRPTPLTFDHNLHRRAQTPLWRIAVSYAALEEDHMIVYWESTHYLKITSAMTDAESDLFTYHQDRRQQRIRAGESWRKLVGDVVLMMRAQWADIDLLLDPYFLHLPTKQDRVRWYPGSVSRAANLAQPSANLPEPTNLITALCECDQADPWRNHYTDPGSVHPLRNIPRLVNKFNPPIPLIADLASTLHPPPRFLISSPTPRFVLFDLVIS
ncbi:hypothetical protein PHMEG_00030499, partial [Phytophthora megakarya]